jgi:hypothetical protein
VEKHPIEMHLREMQTTIKRALPITALLNHDCEQWQHEMQLAIIKRAISELQSMCDVVNARIEGIL